MSTIRPAYPAGSNPGFWLQHQFAYCCTLGLANGSNFTSGLPDFSFRQTAPIQGQNSGSYWNGEGSQYLHHDPSAHAHNGFVDSFDSYAAQESQSGQRNAGGSVLGSSQTQWNEGLASTQMESKDMSRLPSQDINGVHSQRVAPSSTGNIYDEPSRMFPNAQASFHMSSARSDATTRSISPENTALCTSAQQMDLQDFEYPFLGDDIVGVHPIVHRDSNASMEPYPLNVSLSGPSFNTFGTTGDEPFSFNVGSNSMVSQGPVSRESVYNPSTVDSSMLWDNTNAEFLDSQRSSPILREDTWPHQPLMTSTTGSPSTYSPSLEALSPRYVQDYSDLMELPPYATDDRVTRKPMGPRQSKVASDLAANSRQQRLLGSEASDDSFRLVGRSALEIDNTARDHPLYHNVSAKSDGLYHCPWEGQVSCQHKPEKLKCNYDKFVDSHLKPYRCKVVACETLHFSSTACLLRHEREAHAMHGHGDKPYLCTHEGCERGVPGNGFPRHWNLRDHMKRVHNDAGQAKSSSPGRSPPPSAPSRGKKRKADDKPDSQPTEKVRKGVATPPVVVHQPQKPSLTEQYERDLQKATAILEQLRDPREAARNMNLLHSMHDCIKVMAQTSKRINDAPSTGPFTQQSS
ncbi:hypothetical protein LSUB1_G008838 [Lachnellula subtilissima]|uniref:C2H2-type domain-containing protein n=1 Tax=Lachnellula subtilissima TaxID=602034 RepID=A0A8H8U6T7_9HELO|nr:hypothetical protein LSUB1_G008838 [Lachnellula subtilissima]